jgi:hypothetical protein
MKRTPVPSSHVKKSVKTFREHSPLLLYIPQVPPSAILPRVSQIRLAKLKVYENDYFKAPNDHARRSALAKYIHEALLVLIAVIHNKPVEFGMFQVSCEEYRLNPGERAYILKVEKNRERRRIAL